MLRTLIIDDEDHVRDTLRKLLQVYCPQTEVIGEAGSIASARKLISDLNPDLVLLDIQLSDGMSFDLLHSFPSIRFNVIFITAFDKYAIRAFRFSAVDYLLKPVNPEELAEAVKRAGDLGMYQANLHIRALEENLKAVVGRNQKLILKTNERIHLVDLDQVIHCESDDNYTIFNTIKGERILVSRTLKEYEEMLTDCKFYRVHKSHLINLAHVKYFEKQDGGFVVMSDNTRIPVASRKRDELLMVFEKMSR
jgi:two-component system, LytTR family, response regulator